MENYKSIIIHFSNTIGFISAISAVFTLHPQKNITANLLVEWLGLTEVDEEILNIAKTFSKEFTFIKQISLAKDFQFPKSVDEIYFAHDLNEDQTKVLFAKYPKAKRICFGDGFGWVYVRKKYFSYIKGHRESLRIIIRRIFLRLTGKLFWKFPNVAVLILPIDQYGHFFDKCPLIVCKKDTVNEIIEKIEISCQRLFSYINKELALFPSKKIYLFMTEVFAEALQMTLEREIEMYEEMIKKFCQPDSVILIKAHPGEKYPKSEMLNEKLKGKFNVKKISDEYKRYPIEIWKGLILRAEVISCGLPYVTLFYLYDKKVIYPFSKKFIEKWFPENYWPYWKNAMRLCNEPLRKMKTWCGNGPLWVENKNEY